MEDKNLTSLIQEFLDSQTDSRAKNKKRLKEIEHIMRGMREEDIIDAVLSVKHDDGIPPRLTGDVPHERIIAEDCIELARFVINKTGIAATGLKAEADEITIKVYALTPSPVELDFARYATSDYPQYREMLMEKEALESDLFLEDGCGDYLNEIIKLIESAKL